jgi:N-acetylglucosaminyldiphosphoundecaprenol N-acetyl-beta-D-mannosaminyltransferase
VDRRTVLVLGVRIDPLSWDETLARIVSWADERAPRYVCVCNVHSVVTSAHDKDLMRVVNGADMATPDGMPVAWMLRRLGFPGQERINGPDLMWRYCALAEARGQAVYFFGGTAKTLSALRSKLASAFPRLRIAGMHSPSLRRIRRVRRGGTVRIADMHSPPFRSLAADEDAAVVAEINASGAGVVFVCLGCPKQEFWMFRNRGRIHAVMIGVGAAFDFHAGTVKRAPLWMQNVGLEWLHRLASEPRRLWKRYLVTNTIFVIEAVKQLYFKG